ncbi:MAG: selenide, water dikinase SelD [Planctomycetota bacterium]|jgi:selenide,water dikinase
MGTIDTAKRRRIMQRSQKLGHCICDPKRPCPCDVFTGQGICPCAGERPDPMPLADIRLTELVHNAGCASKIAPADLEALLARLPAVDDPAVVSGIAAGDDAGVYDLADGVRVVQTVDVFTPCVDDPFTFGRICAANCLSDIYAMGAVPRTALSVVGFPIETLDGRIMHEMLRGAMEVLAEADVALIGGHSVKDEEIKLGFAITGTVDTNAVSLETARVGDVLVLTKPLGVGVLNFARQIGRSGGDLAAAEQSMAQLNRSACEAMLQCDASACTDVTGFGLFGHLINMARHSGVTAHVYADRLPAFAGVVEALADGVIPGAVERNTEYVAEDISVSDGVDEALVHLGFDAQTSGGLLIAIPDERHEKLVAALAASGVDGWTVGRIVSESTGTIQLTLAEQDASAAPVVVIQDKLPHERSAAEDTKDETMASQECCNSAGEAGSADTVRAFGAFIRSIGQDGALDARAKELITFALVVMARCESCVAVHLDKARKMGISQDELDEAAWCAAAMGGAPVRMFYLAALKAAGAEGGECCSD